MRIRELFVALAMMAMTVSCTPKLSDFCEPSAIEGRNLRSIAELECAPSHGCVISPKACNRAFRFDMRYNAIGQALLEKAMLESEKEYGGTITVDVTGRFKRTQHPRYEQEKSSPTFVVTNVHSAVWRPMFTEREKSILQEKMGITDDRKDVRLRATR